MVESKNNRIEVLDSFRFLAILSVMLFHYYSRWTPPQYSKSMYPYGSDFDYFSFGYLGVQFFFIISGFVIAYTLLNTNSFIDFWKKRMIRLLPSIIFCSLVTLIVCLLVDSNNIYPESHSIKNLLVSFTFVSPDLINRLFPSANVGYTSASYWSLWPEIQFYFFASFIFFINRKHFVRNVVVITLVLWIVNYLIIRVLENVHSTNKFQLNINKDSIVLYNYWIGTIFTFAAYSFYFLLGVLFFQIYQRKKMIFAGVSILILIAFRLLLVENVQFKHIQPFHFVFLMIVIFIVFSLKSRYLKFLAIKPITSVGVASYSLYLIHENIGVLFINRYANVFGDYDFLFPLLVILLMITFSLVSFSYIEKPIGRFLKNKLIK